MKKKHKHYYKCPTIGCQTNISEKKLDVIFMELLLDISIDNINLVELRGALKLIYNKLGTDQREVVHNIKTNLTNTKERMDKLELKHIDGTIDNDTYWKFKERFTKEIVDYQCEIEKNSMEFRTSTPLSNIPLK